MIERAESDSVVERVKTRKADEGHEMMGANGSRPPRKDGTGSTADKARLTRSAIRGESGIPISAFKKWDESRQRALQALEKIVEDEHTRAFPTLGKESIQKLLKAEDGNYWQDRWEVAQAIQRALKEYRKITDL